MTSNTHTVASLLADARRLLEGKSDSPRLDAELLLAHSLEKTRTYLFTWPEAQVEAAVARHFNELIEKRCNAWPIAYLTGSKEFWSLDFTVTTDTLVPRPDTELLVQLAVDALSHTPGPVLDLGTGSGVIAICIAKEHPSLPVDAVDNSAQALAVAQRNAQQHGVEVNFVQSNWYSEVKTNDYQLIVSNPPYIDPNDAHLHRGGLQHEPASALSADNNGMAAIENIVVHASQYCRSGGYLMIEHGFDQGPATRNTMQQSGFAGIRTEQDIEARDRVTLGQIL